MATTGFFNPLTGFSLMFPQPLDEAAARERMLTDRREGRASNERVSAQDFAAKLAQMQGANAGALERANIDSATRKYIADKGVEAVKGKEGRISTVLLHQISNEADRMNRYHQGEQKAWATLDGLERGINANMESSKAALEKQSTSSWWGMKSSPLSPEEKRQKLVLQWEKLKKQIPKNALSYLTVDDDTMTVTNTAPKPEQFNRMDFVKTKLEESGVDIGDLMKQMGGARGTGAVPMGENNYDAYQPGPITTPGGAAPAAGGPPQAGVPNSPFALPPPLGADENPETGLTGISIGDAMMIIGNAGLQSMSPGFGRSLGFPVGRDYSGPPIPRPALR